MAITTVLGGIAIASAFACGLFALHAALSWSRRTKSRADVILGAQEAQVSGLAQVFISLFGPLAKLCLKSKRIRRLLEGLQRQALKRTKPGIALLPLQHFSALVIAAVLGCLALSSIIAGSLAFGLLVTAGLMVLVGWKAKSANKKAVAGIRQSLTDIVPSMSRCFQAGMTLPQTFSHLAKTASGELGIIFSQCANALETGEPIDSALRFLRARKDVPELVFLAAALQIQHQTGGSMKPVLDAATASIRAKLTLEKQLMAQTAQAQLSTKVVAAMPFILLTALTFMSGDYLSPFFSSTAGMGILIVAALLLVSGVLTVRSLLNIKE